MDPGQAETYRREDEEGHMTGLELKLARQKKGIKRGTLGELLGGYYSEQEIRRWESDHPPDCMEQQIREVLDMPGARGNHHPPVRTASGVRFGW